MAADRFTGQTLADCAFCPPDGRRFRTARSCAGCGRPLCLVCRPWIPVTAHQCPDCGGGPPEAALTQPEEAIERLIERGHTPPYWLVLFSRRQAAAALIEEDGAD